MRKLKMAATLIGVVLLLGTGAGSSSARVHPYKLGCAGARSEAVIALRGHFGDKFHYASRYTYCVRRINRTRWRVGYNFTTRNCYYQGYVTVWNSPRQYGYFYWWFSPQGRTCF